MNNGHHRQALTETDAITYRASAAIPAPLYAPASQENQSDKKSPSGAKPEGLKSVCTLYKKIPRR